MHYRLAYFTAALVLIGESAAGQRTAVPAESAGRVSGPAVTMFRINDGSATTADRDVTYQIKYDGAGVLYRVAEGIRPTGGWVIASQGAASASLTLARGPEGTRTLYLEIRKDAVSPVTVKTATVELKYPRADFAASGVQIFEAEFDYGYGASRSKISTSGDSCYFNGRAELSAWGNFPAQAVLGIWIGTSPETICEIKVLLGKNLKPGWTLKAAQVMVTAGRSGVTPLPGARCEVQAAAYGTNVPAITFLVKHPGSLNPFATVATFCSLVTVTFRGPNDPDVTEGLADIL